MGGALSSQFDDSLRMVARSSHDIVDRLPLGRPKPPVDRALMYIHYFSPVAILVCFLAVFTCRSIKVTSPTNINANGSTTPLLYGPGGKPLPRRKLTGFMRERDKKKDFPRSQKILFGWLTIIATFSFIASGAVICLHVLTGEGYWCGEARVIYVVSSTFVYLLLCLSLHDAKPSPTIAQFSTWILALSIETTRCVLFVVKYGDPRLMNGWVVLELVTNFVRFLALVGMVILYILLSTVLKQSTDSGSDAPDEFTRLLNSDRNASENTGNETPRRSTEVYEPSVSTDSGTIKGSADDGAPRRSSDAAAAATPASKRGTRSYGTLANGHPPDSITDDEPGYIRPKKMPSRGWWEYLRSYAVLFPYVWPKNRSDLQAIVVFCLFLVMLQRAFNLLVPYQLGIITNILSGESGKVRVPWAQIGLYILYRTLQGSNGILGAARAALWIPVQQYSYRAMSVNAFEHVHSLSLDFHLNKKTGEVVSALGKGKSINAFLDQATFQVLPMIADLAIAIGYFLIAFDAYYAMIVSIVTFWYIYFTMKLARLRAEARREMTNHDRNTDAIKNDSFQSYETVKYFNAEAWEFKRFKDAISTFQKSEYLVNMSIAYMNVVQLAVFLLGLMVVCFIAAYQVKEGKIKVGKFISLVAYMAQLQTPLNYFGTFYKVIQNAMINAERLLELLKEKPTVVDKPDAKEMPTCNGDIRFQNVQFTYDSLKPALNGMDFHCKPGTTTAFVGESGGGKSTVFRLMFRYYNQSSGSIQVDGQDVQDLKIDSLRSHIGVVPQDTILFNDSIMYNLKYARPDATDEEVYEAAKAASIHKKIMSFPQGYKSEVGERGLRLSGGERQRVAIARTILKQPKIIMLDEATSALDTTTEQTIQKAFRTLAKGRTMLVIAHRLSTIASADQILVLNDGKVVERGNHQELLQRNGHYKTMWDKQMEAHGLATKAYELKLQATRLRRESKGDAAMEPILPSSNEGSDDNSSSRRHKGKRKRSRSRREQNRSDDEAQAQHDALRMRHHEH